MADRGGLVRTEHIVTSQSPEGGVTTFGSFGFEAEVGCRVDLSTVLTVPYLAHLHIVSTRH